MKLGKKKRILASKEYGDIALISRKFKKFMKSQKNKERKPFLKKESSHNKQVSNKKDNSSKDKEKRGLICFKYKKMSHINYNYSLYQSELQRKKKKVMLATWSNSKERLTNEDKANMCFIAIKDHKDKVNFITNNDDDLEGAFEEMYLKLENFG